MRRLWHGSEQLVNGISQFVNRGCFSFDFIVVHYQIKADASFNDGHDEIFESIITLLWCLQNIRVHFHLEFISSFTVSYYVHQENLQEE